MAVYRKTPECSFCGKPIAKAIYKDQSDLPITMQLIGDTFIRWEYKKCKCKGAKKAIKERRKNAIKWDISKLIRRK